MSKYYVLCFLIGTVPILELISRLALKIVVITREQGRGFGQLYFSLLMSFFFRSPTDNPEDL